MAPAVGLGIIDNVGLAVAASSVALPTMTTAQRRRFYSAHIVVDTGTVNVSEDGTAATVSSAGGKVLPPGSSFRIVGLSNYDNVRAIRNTSVSGNLEITREGLPR
jgi:hypothetical protein